MDYEMQLDFYFFFFFKKICYTLNVIKKILFSYVVVMDNLNVFSSVETHLNSINMICNSIMESLSSALEVSGESVGEFWWSMASSISTEFVDLIIKHLLLIKYHLHEIRKHLNDFQEKLDLEKVFVWLQNTIDQLNIIRIQSWFIQREFSFLIEEIQYEARALMEQFSIYA